MTEKFIAMVNAGSLDIRTDANKNTGYAAVGFQKIHHKRTAYFIKKQYIYCKYLSIKNEIISNEEGYIWEYN